MSTKSKNKLGNELGCGLMGRILRLKSHRLRNSLVHSLPTNHVKNEPPKMSPNKEPKVLPRSSTDTALTDPHNKQSSDQRQTRKSTSIHETPTTTHRNNQNQRHFDAAAARSSTSSSSTGSSTHTKVQQNHGIGPAQG